LPQGNRTGCGIRARSARARQQTSRGRAIRSAQRPQERGRRDAGWRARWDRPAAASRRMAAHDPHPEPQRGRREICRIPVIQAPW